MNYPRQLGVFVFKAVIREEEEISVIGRFVRDFIFIRLHVIQFKFYYFDTHLGVYLCLSSL
jgi:hypothetical protein